MLRGLATVALAAVALSGQSAQPPLEPGRLPKTFVPASSNCLEQPDWQVHQYNADVFILRQSGCINYEKPFVYLIFGSRRALLIDTGAGREPKIAAVLQALLAKRGKTPPAEVVVAHSHGHRDHTSGDAELAALPGFRVIPAKPEALAAEFAIANWPAGEGRIDLGDRILDVLAIPGHEPASIAVYDRRTGLLLTGDTLYPGRLYVQDMQVFKASIARLVAFTSTRPVAHILGAHIEQSATPFVDYPVRTIYQPDERTLDLSLGALLELNVVLTNDLPLQRRDFTVVPRRPSP